MKAVKCPECFAVVDSDSLSDDRRDIFLIEFTLEDDEPNLRCPRCGFAQTASDWSANFFAVISRRDAQPAEQREASMQTDASKSSDTAGIISCSSFRIERLARHCLSNLASGIAKLNDAPASAGAHFDSAINELAKATEWRPDEPELRTIIDDAMEHMSFYGK